MVTKSGEPTISIAKRYYILSPWLEGPNPEFTNHHHLQIIAKLLGKMHRLSPTVARSECRFGEAILNEMKQKTILIHNLTAIFEKQKRPNRIDRELLKWSSYFASQADFCIQQIAELTKEEPATQMNLQGFCHNDPSPRNMIIRNGQFHLIDLELSGSGFFIQELAKFIVRVLQTNQWETSLVHLIQEAYATERTLLDFERKVILYLYFFPQHFWRICSQRFEEKLTWTESHFQSKIWTMINSEKLRLESLVNLIPTFHSSILRQKIPKINQDFMIT